MNEKKGGIHLHMAKKSSCHDEEDAQSDATELEENIKDTIKRNVLRY